MDVSIIIVNYNTKELTKSCIDSIIDHTRDIEYEIIVVDNNSTDGSQDELAKYSQIKYIVNDKNLGFGVANNIGYKEAKGKYVFLLNSDTYIKNNALKILYDIISNIDNDIVCIGCMLKDEHGSNTYSYGSFLSINNMLKSAFYHLIGSNKDSGILIKGFPFFIVDVVLGADMFIRRNVIDEELGGRIFDENYFMYHEENDFQKTLNSKGYRCAIVSGPEIIHYGGASDIFKKSYLYNIKSQYYYIKKWYGKFYFSIYKVLLLTIQTIKVLIGNKDLYLKKKMLIQLYKL